MIGSASSIIVLMFGGGARLTDPVFVRQPGDRGEDVPLKEFRIPSNESCVQSETEALIEQDPEAPPTTATQAPLTQLDTARRSSSPRDSSLRRASSLDGVDGVRGEWAGPYGEPRRNSSEWRGEEDGGGACSGSTQFAKNFLMI